MWSFSSTYLTDIFYSILNLSLFEGEQKRIVVVSVPLNANELLAKRAELQELVFLNRSQTKIDRLKKKLQRRMQEDISEWLVDEFM